MYKCNLPYDGQCTLRLEFELSGTHKELSSVLIDTGFICKIYGLKLPPEYKKFVKNLYTGDIKLADTTKKSIHYVQVVITKVEGHLLKKKMPLWAFFMEGRPIVGMQFVEQCKICFDGQNKTAEIEFDY